jgi:hypothetical protein
MLDVLLGVQDALTNKRFHLYTKNENYRSNFAAKRSEVFTHQITDIQDFTLLRIFRL